MARWGVAVPGKLAERARQISDGRLSPAVPRDAATVILLRQAASGVEAFLLRRTAELEFAPGAYVFPGGSVDARDADESVGWAGPDPADFAPCSTCRRTAPGPWSARRSGRRSRNRACCWLDSLAGGSGP